MKSSNATHSLVLISRGRCKPILIVLLIALSSCATPAQPKNMVPQSLAVSDVEPDLPIHDAIAIRKVGGGEKTNPLLFAKVGDDELREALRLSLLQDGFLSISDTDAPFSLDVFLVGLKQPNHGLDAIVDSYIRYTLSRVCDSEVIFDDIVTASFRATIQDAFMGISRLKLATEGSVRTNIATFLEKLRFLDVKK